MKPISVLVVVIVIGLGYQSGSEKTVTFSKFETIRAYIQAWLSKANADKSIMSASDLKKKIVDDWSNQRKKYQIVSVRKPDDYTKAGHIPNAINIYWIDMAKDESLARLDFNKTVILYCYIGHGSAICYTILSLLGYECCSLNFGMMDWNLDALVREPWDQKADYDVEVTVNKPKEVHFPPVIASQLGDAKSIIKEMARKYLSGEGSPVILSSDVKAFIDEWDRKSDEYQVVDVRSKREYEIAHVPRSINIPWARIAEIKNLKKLDPNRTAIVYSENGQIGQMASTVLSLLGYRAVNMRFGMMDWNKSYVSKPKQWDGVAAYAVEW